MNDSNFSGQACAGDVMYAHEPAAHYFCRITLQAKEMTPKGENMGD